MTNSNIKKPCVVQTPQGFSVSYNEQFLYSKYNPSKLIINTVESLSLLPGTIILCCSPVLEYGLTELHSKLPENCLMVLCEVNKDLYDFSINHNPNIISKDNVFFASLNELNQLPVKLYNLCSTGKYKRVIRIDFSAGVQLNKSFYTELETACMNAVGTFWKNRITLTKFGRKYSHNFFINFRSLYKTSPIETFFASIEKPILVFGAGESIDLFFMNNSIKSDDFYILCADTALQPLLTRGITPNGVFIEEAQNVILKAFIGVNDNIHLFAGLSSLPYISKYFSSENISYFTTEYTNSSFINKLKEQKLLPSINQPFGSVGLTTVFYALKFRKNENIPVYVCGLDFSYSLGFTHAKGTLAHTTRLITSNKLIPVENYAAFFSSSALPIKDKNGNIFVTSPTLKIYAELFNNLFSKVPNLYDAGECGYPLAVIRAKPLVNKNTTEFSDNKIYKSSFSEEYKMQITNFLANEKSELIYLKDLLTGKVKLSENDLQEEIKKIAVGKEYLYLHFPDGYSFNYNQSFLNRIRTEIDFFLKVL